MSTPASLPPGGRRGFLGSLVAIGAGAIALLTPIGVGLWSFVSPLCKARGAGGATDGNEGFYKVTKLSALPEDGTPQKFAIVTDRVDAWNKFHNEPVGAVFLRRVPGKSGEVVAWQVSCPHAECAIGFESSEGGRFFCACHGASFNLDGKRLEVNSHSPRDMDTLAVKVENGDEVLVKYQVFVSNQADKVAKS